MDARSQPLSQAQLAPSGCEVLSQQQTWHRAEEGSAAKQAISLIPQALHLNRTLHYGCALDLADIAPVALCNRTTATQDCAVNVGKG